MSTWSDIAHRVNCIQMTMSRANEHWWRQKRKKHRQGFGSCCQIPAGAIWLLTSSALIHATHCHLVTLFARWAVSDGVDTPLSMSVPLLSTYPLPTAFSLKIVLHECSVWDGLDVMLTEIKVIRVIQSGINMLVFRPRWFERQESWFYDLVVTFKGISF